MQREYTTLLKTAIEDYFVAVLNHNHCYYEHSSVQSQQCIEKCLKAILSHKQKPIPRVHNLRVLILKVEQRNIVVPPELKLHADSLSEKYMLTRYYGGTTTPDVSGGFLHVCEIALNWCATSTNQQNLLIPLQRQ